MLRVIGFLVGWAAGIVGAVALYAAAAFGLAELPINRDFRPEPAGIPVGLTSNGVHANLVLPIVTERIDWTTVFPPDQFPAYPWRAAAISFGWGSREFYLNTPTWAELDPGTAASAVLGFGGAAMQVAYWPPWPPGEDYVETRVSPAAYDALVRHILATLAMDAEGRPRRIAGSGYHGNDGFYEARGRYSPFVTCNEWVRRGLADAGIRTALWSPFPAALLGHLR